MLTYYKVYRDFICILGTTDRYLVERKIRRQKTKVIVVTCDGINGPRLWGARGDRFLRSHGLL